MPNHQPQERPAPRLYLITPVIEKADAFAAQLAAALAATSMAAVLLRLKPADAHALIDRVKALAPIAQQKDIAVVLDGHAEIVARAGADGAHLTGIEAFNEAFDTLKPGYIAGCGGLKNRHDAMLAGERGADYVLFGEPDAQGRRPSLDALIERIAWWTEIFTTPCVGFAASADEIVPLVAAGADFVAVGDFIWADGRGPAAALADVASRFQHAKAPA